MNKNNIIRVQKNKENPYVMINKHCINNCNLSWAAKGLHSYIMGLPDDWILYVSELIKHTSAGREHTYTVIRELITNGYMQRFEYRHKGKVVKSEYVAYETPIEVDVDNLTKNMATIIKVNDNGEVIENTLTEPFTENTNSVTIDSVKTKLLINKGTKKELVLKNDPVVVVAEKTHTEKVVDLYKSYKIHSRVIPQMVTLLKKYAEYFTLEVFEYIFIQASEDSVSKKYNYIESLLKTFYAEKIYNITKLEEHNKKFENSKDKNFKKSNRTQHHKINQTYKKYTEEELEAVLEESQLTKFRTSTTIADCKQVNISDNTAQAYETALSKGILDINLDLKNAIISYAKDNNRFIPTSWICDK